MIQPIVNFTGWAYRNIFKKILFLHDPEAAHLWALALGVHFGDSGLAKKILSGIFKSENPSLRQSIFGINFKNPVGLGAGFDYEAKLTQILPSLGFGFETIGTLTNRAYGGNPKPILGRLPRSRSLMVDKGFKNLGIAATLGNLKGKTFDYPVGVSIGKTNTPNHKTQWEAVADIVSSFRTAESSEAPFSYYELNISCPNLSGTIDFYKPEHLKELLEEVGKLGLSRPVFVKMPISKTDDEIRSMMDAIIQYPYVEAVVLGNVQTNRQDPALVPEEVSRFPKGNFSGLPCREGSDELIKLAFKEYGSSIKIIGCGGIFSAEDAYRKIKLGASLVQLITGLIYEGPQLVSQINNGLTGLLKKDGYKNISEAVGVE